MCYNSSCHVPRVRKCAQMALGYPESSHQNSPLRQQKQTDRQTAGKDRQTADNDKSFAAHAHIQERNEHDR